MKKNEKTINSGGLNSGQLRMRQQAVERWRAIWREIELMLADGHSILAACGRYVDERASGEYSSPRSLYVSLRRARRKYGV